MIKALLTVTSILINIEDCPPNRPNKRIVEGTTTTCNISENCASEIKCDKSVCWRISNDCDICTSLPEMEICLTDEELRDARSTSRQKNYSPAKNYTPIPREKLKMYPR
jgi:hypothetical protein